MGIRFSCPNGHKLNVKEFLAGKRGICPQCGAKLVVPESGQPEPAILNQMASDRDSASGLTAAELGSQSVIIAVADLPSSGQLIEPPPVTLQPVPPSPATSAVPAAVPGIVTRTATAPRQATGYELRRERDRRKQATMAVILLVAVIVLAIILIVVLQNGSEPPRPPAVEPARVAQRVSQPHIFLAGAPS